MKVKGGKLVKVEHYRRVIKNEASSHIPAKALQVPKKRYNEVQERCEPDRKLFKRSTSNLLPEKEDSAPSTSTFSPIITSVVSLASGTPMRIKGRQRVPRCSDQELKNTDRYRIPKVIKDEPMYIKDEPMYIKDEPMFINSESHLNKNEIKGIKDYLKNQDPAPRQRYEAQERCEPDMKFFKHSTSHVLPEKEDSAPSTSTFSPIITSVVSLASSTPMRINGMQRVPRCRDQELKNTNTYRIPKVIKKDSQLKKTEIKGAKRFVNTKDTMTQIKITTKRINRLMSCISSKLSSINHMCLSTDSIRGLTKGKSYTQVMGHFHDGLSLQSVSLGIIEIADNTPVASVTQAFADICEKWKISPVKVTAVVGSLNYSINGAVKCLFGKNKFLYCFAEQMNRVASKVIGEQVVKETFWKVKEIRSFVNDIQGEISGTTNGEDISLDKPESQNGNWVSDYKLLERYLEYSQGKYGTFCPLKMLNNLEVIVARDVRDILKIMYLVLGEFGQGEQTYSSEIIPMVSLFKKRLSTFIPLSAKGKDLKNKLENIIYEKFQYIELAHLLAISTLLDPRFKDLYFDNSQAASEAVRQIINILHAKMRKPGIQQGKGQGEQTIWEMHDARFTNSPPVGNASEELGQFLDDPILSRTDTDPIQYWVQNAKRFPNLFRVANSYLCVPGTSVPRMKTNLEAGMKFGGKRGKAMLEKRLFFESIPKSYLESHV